MEKLKQLFNRDEKNREVKLVYKIGSYLECPVCMELFQNEVYQCENGHNICAECNNIVEFCPICREKKCDIRNLAVEDISIMFNKYVNSLKKTEKVNNKSEKLDYCELETIYMSEISSMKDELFKIRKALSDTEVQLHNKVIENSMTEQYIKNLECLVKETEIKSNNFRIKENVIKENINEIIEGAECSIIKEQEKRHLIEKKLEICERRLKFERSRRQDIELKYKNIVDEYNFNKDDRCKVTDIDAKRSLANESQSVSNNNNLNDVADFERLNNNPENGISWNETRRLVVESLQKIRYRVLRMPKVIDNNLNNNNEESKKQ